MVPIVPLRVSSQEMNPLSLNLTYFPLTHCNKTQHMIVISMTQIFMSTPIIISAQLTPLHTLLSQLKHYIPVMNRIMPGVRMSVVNALSVALQNCTIHYDHNNISCVSIMYVHLVWFIHIILIVSIFTDLRIEAYISEFHQLYFY